MEFPDCRNTEHDEQQQDEALRGQGNAPTQAACP